MLCPKCGKQFEPGCLFCDACGTPLNSADAAPAFDASFQPTPPVPPKKSRPGLVIGIIAGLIAVIVAVILLISNSGPSCAVSGCYEKANYGSYCVSHVCLSGSCTNRRVSGSSYCSIHNSSGTSSNSYSGTSSGSYCAASGCYERAQFGSYCVSHVCMSGSCTNRRASGSIYCSIHKSSGSSSGSSSYSSTYCAASGCYEKAQFGSYCVSHVCMSGSCTNRRASGSIYCSIHGSSGSSSYSSTYCAASGCYEKAQFGSYCVSHVCMSGSCTNRRASGSIYCSIHK